MPPSPTSSRLFRRLAKTLGWVATFAGVVAVVGFFVAPPLVKSKAQSELARILHRPVAIEAVAINPFVPSLTVRGFAVREKDGAEVALSFDELYVNVSYASLLRFAPVVQALTLRGPQLRLVRHRDRSYNFQDLIDEALAAPPSDAPPPRFAVHNIEVTGGRIEFDDRLEDEKHAVTDLHLGVPFISSLPSQVDINVVPALAAKVDGARFEVKGETKPFKDTRETSLALDVDGLDLPRYLDYSPVPLGFRMPSGKFDSRLRLAFTTQGDKLRTLTLSGSAALSQIALQDAAGAPLADVARLAVELDSVDLLGRKATIRTIGIDAPSAQLVRRRDGSINLQTILPSAAAGRKGPDTTPAADAPPFGFAVNEIRLQQGRIAITDEAPTRPFKVALENIGATVDGLANAPGMKAAVKAGFDTDAKGRFDYAGSVQLAPGLTVDGRIELGGWRLGALHPYYEDVMNLDVRDGTLAASAQFEASLSGGALAARMSALNATIGQLRLHFPGEKDPLARIASVEVKDGALDLAQQRVEIAEAAIRDAVIQVIRDRDGSFLVERVFKFTGGGSPSAPAAGAPAWRIDTKLLRLDKAVVNFEDRSPSRPAKLQIAPLTAKIEGLSTAKAAKQIVTVDARVGKTGRLAFTGPIVIDPFDASLRITARAIPLPPVQSYLDPLVNAAITAGTASVSGTLRVSLPERGPPRVSYRGDASVEDFASVDTPASSDLLKWKSLFLGGVDFELEPLKALVAEVALSDFYSRLILNANGTLNLQNLAQPSRGAAPSGAPTAAAPAPVAAAPASPPAAGEGALPALPPNLRIGRITLQGGNVNFSDFFIRPNYSANLTGIGGTVTEMTSDKAGEVDLRGKVDDSAPLEILGRLNLLAKALFLDLKAAAKDIELPPLSPYSVKYAGYGIERGKLSVDVKYLVENRRLSAENHVYLDQLTFGEKVDSPTATKLPVLLAVSLLKDRNGVIDINLPISGSLDDPQFSLGRIIIQVIVNLITKAVTAPFALLSAAFGGGEEFSQVEFAPGAAALSADGRKRLDALAKALNDRPGLKLDIAGRVDPDADREGVKRAALDEKLRAQKAKQAAAQGATPLPPGEAAFEPAEYPALLKAAYDEEKFPKPRNALFLPKSLPVAEMETLMLANLTAGEEELRQLANRRAQAAKSYLVDTGKVPAARVFLVAPKLGADEPKDKGKASRAEFALR